MSTLNAFQMNCHKKYASGFKFGNDDNGAAKTPIATITMSNIGVDASPYIQLQHAPKDTPAPILDQFVKFNDIVLKNFDKLSGNILHASYQVMKMLDSVVHQVGDLGKAKVDGQPEKAESAPAA